MNAWSNSLAAVASLLTLGLPIVETPRAEVPSSNSVEFVDMPDAFRDMARWATDLFDEAGLELPAIRFEYHGDTTSCNDREGTHRTIDDRSIIQVCRSQPGMVSAGMILHETAHAWAAWSLDDERKARFQLLRGWTHWRDHEAVRWHENGSEQAAEIIRWGLIDRPIRIVRINDNSCDDLDAGYRTLTGQPPLHGFRDEC